MVEITMAPEEEAYSSSSPAGDEYNHGWKYDVFLSFRGEDTRKNFVDHLYSAFVRSGIHTFKDDQRLEIGESISPALLKAIEESMIAVIVFSKTYATSRWCLDELVKIMECRRDSSKSSMGPQTVFPIFYDVEPSEVRKPDEGYFGEMISQHDPAKVETWRQALGEAANLSGLELKKTADGHEAKFIDIVLDKICTKLLDIIPSDQDKGLVGMKSRVEEVTSLLDLELDAVRIVGIWGLSGIGKTTLAKAIFCRVKNQFQAACFLKDVGEESKKHGLNYLLQQLLSQLLREKDLKINNDCDGDNIKRRLRSIKVLLVLDDVDHLDQLEVLGKFQLYRGSRIVITTRNEKLLDGADEIYKARLFNDAEAIRQFTLNAFKGIRPEKDFEDLSDKVIQYAGGLPLALKVLGSTLCGENLDFWKATLEKLRKAGPDADIIDKLKIGFDGLDKEVQEAFLDIACLFQGQKKEHVTRILESFDFFPNRSIPILIHRALIYVSEENELCMHQLVQEMGRHIDRKNPRRLWQTDDIVRVSRSPTGTKNIEGVSLHPRKRKSINIANNAFRKMRRLRLLEVGNVQTARVPKYLPSELKWLIWEEFPSESLPRRFKPHNLVGLQLRHSRIERPWNPKKMMDKLKYIDLQNSEKLIETPEFTRIPNLEELNLKRCTSLVVVHQSLGALKRLHYLNLYGCTNLKTLPNDIHSDCLKTFNMASCISLQKFPEIRVIMKDLLRLDLMSTAIRELPSSIQNLSSLVSLSLFGCSELEKLPEDLGCLKCLEELRLDETAIKEVPSSIQHLSNLAKLSLCDNKNLSSLPSAVCKLKRLERLYLSGCSELKKLPENLGYLECLEELDLDETAIKEVPSSIQHLSSLAELSLRDNKNLSSLPSAVCKLKHLERLYLSGCSELETLSEDLGCLECLEELDLDGTAIKEVPSSIQHLSSLTKLSLRDNKNLSSFPSAVCKLKRLEGLYLSGCSELENLPEDLKCLECLEELDLNGTAIKEVPSSIQFSSPFVEIYLTKGILKIFSLKYLEQLGIDVTTI